MNAFRALLLTDVVDSTQMSESLGDPAMGELWSNHDRVARDLLDVWRGREIDKTDGMLLLFDAATDAASYALAYHSALAALPIPLRARAGLHVGPIVIRHNSDRDVARGAKPLEVDGLAKPTAARVMALALGGQTLLTAEARSELGDMRPQVQSHGHWMMKGLSEPLEIFELGAPDRPYVAPLDCEKAYRVVRAGDRWLPVKEIANNLPQPATTFIGREKELVALKRLLGGHRLVTLSGSGGSGKTRLALQLAGESLEQYPDGVWLVELAPLTDPARVPQMVATVLGLKEEPGRPIVETLTAHLKNKRLLLLLDNCEHLLDGCAQLTGALIRQSKDVKIVASSREALRVGGEQNFRVPSLSLPDPNQAHTPASVAPFEAVQLFADRALLCRPDFEVTHRNASALASVCYRLDGIPLAIELAAARVRYLSVEEINHKLDQRFQLLTGGARTALPRQQTLRSLIDWSYDLLSDQEKLTLQRLSVFIGGWTLPSAEQVCSGDGVSEQGVLDLLTSLCDKSLVVAEQDDGHTRYGLLETVRQYSRERLLESGGANAIRQLHQDHFLALAEEAEPNLSGPEQLAWLQRLEKEHQNLRAALDWSWVVESGSRAGLRLCGALQRFWWTRGHLAEGRDWCMRVLGKEGAEERTLERAKVLNGAGVLAIYQADYPAARALHEECLAIRRELGDRRGVAASLGNLGTVARAQGAIASARLLHEESLAIRRELGSRGSIARSLNNLGNVALDQGDYAAARRLLEETLEITRELGDRWSIANSLNSLGDVAYAQADYPAALALHEECLAIMRELGERKGIASALSALGDVARQSGDFAAARELYKNSLVIQRELGDAAKIAESLEGLAAVGAALGVAPHAACIWGAAEGLREGIGSAPRPYERPNYDQHVAAARRRGDSAAFERAWQEGRALTLEQAIEFALEETVERP
jgi:predicted ATPase/class 3 adenylate cyclase